jgi:hypothetical protein
MSYHDLDLYHDDSKLWEKWWDPRDQTWDAMLNDRSSALKSQDLIVDELFDRVESKRSKLENKRLNLIV